ncbi:MAG: PQQ-dependent sugar dehydrogenase [Proteobacteria bacterium]|nr:PQQ-dependent sugar dehydrogenase [Pseudomonadota bacterium]
MISRRAGLLAAAPLVFAAARAAGLPLERIKLPRGFKIELYAEVPNARSLAAAPGGVVFVGSREREVYALIPDKSGARAEKVVRIASGLRMPNGVAFRDGSLYVAEIHRVLRFDKILESLEHPPDPVVVKGDYPSDEWHGWKFIRFGPDGYLYVPVGAPCNTCERGDPYAALTRVRPDGTGYEVFARGIRNTVGFDWDPRTRELWFTDNGRDRLGDESPPDELNHAPRSGMNFGFPYCHGGDAADPEYGAKFPCAAFVPPAQKLGPHVASLGMRFYDGTMFPEAYRGQILIAEHGSWNRSRKIGYRLTSVRLKDGRPIGYKPFATGWLEGESVWGRPVDVETLADGSLLVSDDHAGAVYRITYRKP